VSEPIVVTEDEALDEERERLVPVRRGIALETFPFRNPRWVLPAPLSSSHRVVPSMTPARVCSATDGAYCPESVALLIGRSSCTGFQFPVQVPYYLDSKLSCCTGALIFFHLVLRLALCPSNYLPVL